ncbi:putative ABC transport system substrate-binding protein [Chryseomicrobium aureum]|uniref:ABC transporter substrate-binding protein n=1 Tax=Chryseomicrobium aureum TaxID=1441723 RepID=UPI0019585DB1|nr:ABC transporter substrate-binding protein [Chryseomicrobium aureum]MBM7705571.1 putative ABC transport system substrate-binding protein [Chryseomicrobium aureum]
MNWKKSLGLLALSSTLLLAACGDASQQAEGAEDQVTIGVTQIVEHPSLNAAFEGFQKAIEDAGIDANYQIENAQNDTSANTTIATNLVSAEVDLIFANSTPSAQAVASATSEIPIVFTSVTDAVSAELVQSMESPGGNVTGTVDTQPEAIPSTMKFLKDNLNATSVGMVFNSGEQNSRAQVDRVKEEAAKIGIEIAEASVATSAEVKQATESLIGKVDALYIITDNTVVSALESVISVANDNQLPVMVGEFDSVARGGLGAYGFDYFDIGYEAGEMAAQILSGEKTPADLPVQYPQNVKFVVNKDAADTLGITIDESWNAEIVE